ncbi:MAG: phosphatidate cytidylyltransferase [Anaerolineae bacterium]|nr:phosphatidate cytidylyltransferase [Anaerolineae bacterium]
MIIPEVFLVYLTLLVALLVLVGLILILLDKVLHKNVSSVWNIYRGWLMMIPVFMLFVFLGRIAFILGVLAVSIFSFGEFSHATKLNAAPWIIRVVYIGIVIIAILAIIPIPDSKYFGWYGLFVVLPVYVIGFVLLVPILQNRYEGQLQAVALGMMGFLYFGWMLGHLSFFANAPHFLNYVLYIVFAVQIADIAGYNFGKLFGRHKLRSNISPNKTVEGSVGTLVVSLCLPWLFHSTLPGFGPLQLFLTGLIVGIGSQLGDLSISLIKRDLGIKDMGTLIPGHGGILDRIDSLIIATPLFFHMIRYFGILYP